VRRPIAAAALLTALALSGFPPAVASAQPPGTDVGTCADGTCTLTVSGPVEIRFDRGMGATALSITDVGPYAVTFQMRSGSGRSYAMTGPGGTVRFASGQGTLTIRVLDLAGGTATIALSSTPSQGPFLGT
jgi:hypothetical protein